MGVGPDSFGSLYSEIENCPLPRVSRDFHLCEIVASSHHDWSATRQSIVEHRGMVNDEAAQISVVEKLAAEVELRLEIGLVAVIVELLLSPAKDDRIAIPASGSSPLPAGVGIHPLVIGATQERQIVYLEAWAPPVLRCLP